MLTACGNVKIVDGKLIGRFDVSGSPRYITVDVKPFCLSFQCHNATLNYDDSKKLVGECNGKGNAGRDELWMGFGDGVWISGPLDASRTPNCLRGRGKWTTGDPHLLPALDSPAGQFPSYDSIRDLGKVEREQQLLKSGYPIIVIFGQSGSGKSTFINLITSEVQNVGDGLQSCTRDISVIKASIGGQPVVVLDTPGIDDTHSTEGDVFECIAKYFGSMGESQVHVTGVLFMHPISDNKFTKTANRISTVIRSLCGPDAMKQMTLCTTKWDTVPESDGCKRYSELCDTQPWKEMLANGASATKIGSTSSNAQRDAETIVSQLIKNAEPVELAIQDEMVNKNLPAANTSAGKILDGHQKTQAESDRMVKGLIEKRRKRRKVDCVIQ